MRSRIAVMLFLSVFFLPVKVRAEHRFFLILFGSQQMPPEAEHAHSFGTFLKVTEVCGKRTIEHHTISWLPESGVIRLPTLLPEPGRNYGLHETIRLVFADGQRVSVWGPYEIRESLYNKSIRQRNKFARWNTSYKAIDSGYPNFLVSNCIHALSAVAGVNRMRVASPSWGETASFWIVRRYQVQGLLLHPKVKHCWLIRELGLDSYPLIYRDLRPPRTGYLWSLIRSETAGEGRAPLP